MRSLLIQDKFKAKLAEIIASYNRQYEEVIVDPCLDGSVNIIGGINVFSSFHRGMIFIEKKRETVSSNKLKEIVEEYKSVWGVNLHAFTA